MWETTFQPSGFSQYAGITTSPQGATVATDTNNAVTNGPAGSAGLCTLCSNPTFRPIIFGAGAVLILLAWHFHVLSMIE
jgi:hypothetical protein